MVTETDYDQQVESNLLEVETPNPSNLQAWTTNPQTRKNAQTLAKGIGRTQLRHTVERKAANQHCTAHAGSAGRLIKPAANQPNDANGSQWRSLGKETGNHKTQRSKGCAT